MQMQKDDATPIECDVFLANNGFAHRIMAKLGRLAMRGMQSGHASSAIASHLQHDYLPVIEGN